MSPNGLEAVEGECTKHIDMNCHFVTESVKACKMDLV